MSTEDSVTADEISSTPTWTATPTQERITNIYDARVIIILLLASILLPMGTIGNILSLIVFCKQKSTNAFTILLRTLCVVDCMHVLMTEIGNLLRFSTHGAISLEYYLGCDASLFVRIYFRMFSSGILVLITLERVIAISFPYRVKTICSPRNGVISMLALGVFFLPLALPQIGKATFSSVTLICVPTLDQAWVFKLIAMFVLLFYTVLPTLLLILLNSILIYKLMRKQQVGVVGAVISPQAAKERRFSVMALVLTCTFIVCTLPETALLVGIIFTGRNQYLLNIMQVLSQLSVLNHAVNCILYACCSSKFRVAFKAIICCQLKCSSSVGNVVNQ